MTNLEAVNFFDGHCKGAFVDKMFWIAASSQSYDLREMLEDMDDEKYLGLFGIKKSSSKHELITDLICGYKNGVIAEVHIPRADNFRFDGNKVISWSSHQGLCRPEFVYAETLSKLAYAVEKAANKVFKEYINEFKEKSIAKVKSK